ncbi:hypothetical protein B4135_0157 [Caldibacillus debilis]|uniref:Uncharacterized protein n=1 Tax=Caldibacillus debilis TaxID=301148 RepID=A0A150LVN8_9BACI|nr:hypothetical protein B4135_0157 [Caldibacillus debilis]
MILAFLIQLSNHKKTPQSSAAFLHFIYDVVLKRLSVVFGEFLYRYYWGFYHS